MTTDKQAKEPDGYIFNRRFYKPTDEYFKAMTFSEVSKPTPVYFAAQPKQEAIYFKVVPETESGTWYRDQAGEEFYLQKVVI